MKNHSKVYRIAGIAEHQRAEDHLRLVIDTIPTMAWSLLHGGPVDFVNQRWLDYTGLSREAALEDPNCIVHPEDLPRALEKWRPDMAAGKPSEDTLRLRRADGEYRWFLVRTVPLRNEQGQIVKWYGTSTDIEDRMRAEDALRQSEDRLRLVIETIPAMVWTASSDGSIDFVNGRWLEYIGLSWDEFQARGWPSLIHPEDRGKSQESWEATIVSGEPTQIEHRVRCADGQYRWVQACAVPLRGPHGRIVEWYGTATDIDDRKRADETLRQSAEELKALSRGLVDLQESERKKLARELHDRVGQSLTALNINLAILRQALSQHDAAIRARLEDSASVLKSTALAIENVVSELRPPMLDDHGLRSALDWYANEFAARTGISVTVHATEPGERVAAEVEIALFRIAQEALNNVAKHARARRVEITLDCQETGYVMSVKDDGVGLHAAEEQVHRRRAEFGMVTMRERAQALGGCFEIESLAGAGTQLTVRIPK